MEYGAQRTEWFLVGRWRVVSRTGPNDRWRYEVLALSKWAALRKVKRFATRNETDEERFSRLLQDTPVIGVRAQ